MKGEVEICHGKTIVKVVKEGEIFGKVEFFTDAEYRESARSNDFTTILKLNR